MTVKTLGHRFVRFIPDELEDETLYVSMEFATAVHKCCCGCGGKVVTPLTPTDWKLIFNGVSVSLKPSVNNSGFECESHYFVSQNSVVWAPRVQPRQLGTLRLKDRLAKDAYYEADDNDREPPFPAMQPSRRSRLTKLLRWLGSNYEILRK